MAKVLIGLIRFYQRVISPWKVPRCRFYPTCSEYAIGAIGEYGLIFGVFLALKRILRCHPFHPGGYDPLDTDRHGLKVHGWAQINQRNISRQTKCVEYPCLKKG